MAVALLILSAIIRLVALAGSIYLAIKRKTWHIQIVPFIIFIASVALLYNYVLTDNRAWSIENTGFAFILSIGCLGFVFTAGYLLKRLAIAERFDQNSDLPNQELLKLTLATSPLEMWRWNFIDNEVHSFRPEGESFSWELLGPIESSFGEIHHEDVERVSQALDSIRGGASTLKTEYRVFDADGRQICLHVRGKVIQKSKGDPSFMMGTVHNITKRKATENALKRSETQLRLSLEAARLTSWELDLTSNKVISYSLSEDAPPFTDDIENALDWVHPDDREMMLEKLAHCIASGEAIEAAHRVLNKEGGYTWSRIRGILERDAAGNAIRLVGVSQDIDENKRAQIALQESEERLRLATDGAGASVFDIEIATGKIHVTPNKILEEALGNIAAIRTLSQAVKHLPANFQEQLYSIVSSATERDYHYSTEIYLRPEGLPPQWISVRGRVIPDDKQLPVRIVGTVQLITKQKEREKTLEFQSKILDTVDEIVVAKDLEGRFIYANEIGRKMLGIEGKITEPLDRHDTVPPEDRIENWADVMAVLRSGDKWQGEILSYHADGSRVPVILTAAPIFDDDNKLTGIIGIATDIQKQREAENALRESEHRLRLSLEAACMAVWDWDAVSHQVQHHISDAIAPYLPATFPENFDAAMLHIYKPDRRRVQTFLRRLIVDRELRHAETEYRVITPSEKLRWMGTQVTVHRDAEGRALRVVGTIQDITDRKDVEEALRSNEQHSREVYERTPVMMHSFDATSEVTDVSDLWLEKMGYKRDEVLGRQISAFMRESSRRFVNTHLYPKLLQKGICQTPPLEFLRKDGSIINIEMSVIAEIAENGELAQGMAVLTDVSELVRTEAALRVRYDQMQALYQMIDAMSQHGDLESIFEAATNALLTALGADSAGVLIYQEDGSLPYAHAKNLSEAFLAQTANPCTWIHEERPAPVAVSNVTAFEPMHEQHNAYAGDNLNAALFVPFLYREQRLGKIIALYRTEREFSDEEIQLAQKIADHIAVAFTRNQVMTALRESEERLRLAIDAGELYVWDWDIESNRVVNYFPESLNETVQKAEHISDYETIMSFIHPQDVEQVQAALHTSITNGSLFAITQRMRGPSGAWYWIDAAGEPEYDAQGQPVRMVGYARNITEKRNAELSLEKRYAQLQALYHLIDTASQGADLKAIFESAMNGLSTTIKAKQACLMLFDEGDELQVAYAAEGSSPLAFAVTDALDWPKANAKIPHPLFLGDVRQHRKLTEVLKAHEAKDFRALSVLPLVYETRLLGHLLLCFDEIRAFPPEEIQLSQSVVDHLAVVIVRKEAQEALLERTVELQTLTDHLPDQILRINRNGEVLYANPAVVASFATRNGGLTGQHLSHLFASPEVIATWEQHVEQAFATGERVEMEFSVDGNDYHQFFHAIIVPERRLAGMPQTVVVISREITEQRLLQKEVLEISTREQRRIGQDLHDELGQILTGIGFQIQGLRRDLEEEKRDESEDAALINDLVVRAIELTRTLAEGLNPIPLNEDGLLTGLERLLINTRTLYGIDCKLDCPKNFNVANNEVASQVYYIVVEAITNAVKHGKADAIKVKLSQRNGRAVLTVTDNGIGMNPSTSGSNGQGLRIMNYRAGMIGGSFSIKTEPNRGTKVSCTFKNPVS